MELKIRFTDAQQKITLVRVPVRELDQDRHKIPDDSLSINVDFSQDRTGFFNAPASRNVVLTEVADRAYFFDDMNLDPTPARVENTFIWHPDGFNSGGGLVLNEAAYRGYLLYVYGIHNLVPPIRSGGVEIETAGNFNELGWLFHISDNNWWLSGNFGKERNDLYSIAHHETGHAISFEHGQPKWQSFKDQDCVNDPAVIAYNGSCPAIDTSDHLNGTVDRESHRGAFGYEYFGDVPARRWFITKLDLLVAQAVGYKLRKTSAFIPLAIGNVHLPAGSLGRD
jgi:hypothetical protein